VEPDKILVRRTIYKLGEEVFPMLFEVKRADILAQSDYKRQEKLERLHRWRQIYEEIIREKDCISLKMLAVDGKDLIALGLKPGKELGDTLVWLLELVLEYPEHNKKEYLLSLIFRGE
jgi:tRNA nucleotidyltransferase (CCA-adding enzyme)